MSRERLVMKTVCVAAEVVDRAKSGDGAAFAELVQTHQAEVRSFLYRMTAHRQDAEDLSQEVWLRVHRKLPAFEGRASFRTWLFRVATNLARDEHRARQRWPVNAQDVAKELAESGPETAAEFRRVERDAAQARYEIREHIDFCLTCIMKSLPLEQQLAVMLCEMYGFTNTEAADVLEVSLGVLKHLLHDARSTLDRVFEQRCALINKRGVCHQCSELNGFFNPRQNQQEALASLDLVQATHDGRQNLLDLRLQLARAINPLDDAGSDLQESIMSVCRAAIAKNHSPG